MTYSILQSCDPAKKKSVVAGGVLLHEGTRSGYIYVLAEGVVEVLRGETTVAVVSEAGALFGEMSLLLDIPHTATVRAKSDCVVYAYDDAAAFLRSDPQTAFAIARVLAQRLNMATTYLVDLKRQYAGHGNHLGMVSDVLASLVNQQPIKFEPGSDRQPDPEM